MILLHSWGIDIGGRLCGALTATLAQQCVVTPANFKQARTSTFEPSQGGVRGIKTQQPYADIGWISEYAIRTFMDMLTPPSADLIYREDDRCRESTDNRGHHRSRTGEFPRSASAGSRLLQKGI
jgi:hypothetical protein